MEEAPAPGFPDELRHAMGEAAVKVAKAVGYYNAGTVEFIYQDGDFFFLEMNTRLQVEHPVTEIVTGVDLVERQSAWRRGEPLPFTQDEARSAAATPSRSASTPRTRPAAGSCLARARSPSSSAPDGFGVRFDGGYESGDTISQYYDNLIGKLIVWGRDRPTAIARTVRALEEMVVEGVATTIPADLAILRHPDFAALSTPRNGSRRASTSPGSAEQAGAAPPADDDASRRSSSATTTVEVDGRRFAVTMWVPEATPVRGRARRRAGPQAGRAAPAAAPAARSGPARSPCRCRARS